MPQVKFRLAYQMEGGSRWKAGSDWLHARLERATQYNLYRQKEKKFGVDENENLLISIYLKKNEEILRKDNKTIKMLLWGSFYICQLCIGWM
jgi:hypothetical protein